jgi:hypothetical protein
MIHTLHFESGDTTCAKEPGKFCRFFGTKNFGTQPVCMLFDDEPLYEKDGWIQRARICMASFGKELL